MIALSLLFLVFIGRCAFGCYGPYFGIVLDADNYLPVRHAQVKVEVDYYGFLGEHIATDMSFSRTNFLGLYFVPGTYQTLGIFFSTMDFKLYKHGYIAYMNGGVFRVPKDSNFLPIFNVVLLKKWDDTKFTDEDHRDHVGIIGCSIMSSSKTSRRDQRRLKKFCMEAREEMIHVCETYNPKFPTPPEKCIEIVNKQLGLVKK